MAMTLEIAVEGASADAAGDETARRLALVDRVRSELTVLSDSLAGTTNYGAAEADAASER